MVSDGNDRVTQVNAGRAYVRVQLAATAQGVVMQPLQQALQEYPEQAAPHAQIRRLLGAAAPGADGADVGPRRLRAAGRAGAAARRRCAHPARMKARPTSPRPRDRARHRRAHPRRGGRGAGARRLRRARHQRHRARGGGRQGADLPLLRRPARAAAQLGRERPLLADGAGAAGRRSAGACWRCRWPSAMRCSSTASSTRCAAGR